MADEGSFLRAILAKPADDLPRLVYADWLDEQQTDAAGEKAEFLRLVVAFGKGYGKGQQHKRDRVRVRELAEKLPVGWLAAVSHAAVENCAVGGTAIKDWRLRRSLETVSFAFECPKQWAEMTPTEDDQVRHCGACKRNVHFCDTLDEAKHHAWAGECVALNLAVPREKGDLDRPEPFATMGLIAPSYWEEGETVRDEG